LHPASGNRRLAALSITSPIARLSPGLLWSQRTLLFQLRPAVRIFRDIQIGNPEGRNRAQSQALLVWTVGFSFHLQRYASLSRVYTTPLS
jgi:hypothetical protein